MRKIYCPTDFSELSKHALDWAIALGAAIDAPVHVLHTYQVPYSADMMSNSLNEALKESSEKEMDRLLKPYIEEGIHLHPELEWNSVTGALRSRAKKEPEMMVVMGSHGASGWNEALLGSNAVAVMQSLRVPTLIIPGKTHPYKEGMKWLYASDLQDENNPKALDWMKQFVADAKHHMELMHVECGDIEQSNAEDFLDYARENFDGYPTHLCVHGSIEEGIYQCAETHGVDGIIMIGRRHHWLLEAFHQSMTRAIAHHQKFPVLILKED